MDGRWAVTIDRSSTSLCCSRPWASIERKRLRPRLLPASAGWPHDDLHGARVPGASEDVVGVAALLELEVDRVTGRDLTLLASGAMSPGRPTERAPRDYRTPAPCRRFRRRADPPGRRVNAGRGRPFRPIRRWVCPGTTRTRHLTLPGPAASL